MQLQIVLKRKYFGCIDWTSSRVMKGTWLRWTSGCLCFCRYIFSLHLKKRHYMKKNTTSAEFIITQRCVQWRHGPPAACCSNAAPTEQFCCAACVPQPAWYMHKYMYRLRPSCLVFWSGFIKKNNQKNCRKQSRVAERTDGAASRSPSAVNQQEFDGQPPPRLCHLEQIEEDVASTGPAEERKQGLNSSDTNFLLWSRNKV